METVNMGQGGYGLDQAYLWYARDGVALDHNVQIFAFIGSDLTRMASDTLEGYPKPTLRVQDDRLAVENIPVPELRASARFMQGLNNFRDLAVRRSLATTSVSETATNGSRPGGSHGILGIVSKVFDHLADLNRRKDSELMTYRAMLKRSKAKQWRRELLG